jgi:hypothetical protein
MYWPRSDPVLEEAWTWRPTAVELEQIVAQGVIYAGYGDAGPSKERSYGAPIRHCASADSDEMVPAAPRKPKLRKLRAAPRQSSMATPENAEERYAKWRREILRVWKQCVQRRQRYEYERRREEFQEGLRALRMCLPIGQRSYAHVHERIRAVTAMSPAEAAQRLTVLARLAARQRGLGESFPEAFRRLAQAEGLDLL